MTGRYPKGAVRTRSIGVYAIHFVSSPQTSPYGYDGIDVDLDFEHAYGPDAALTWQALAIAPEPSCILAVAACLALPRARRRAK